MHQPHYVSRLKDLGYVRVPGSGYDYENVAAGVCLGVGPIRVWGAYTHHDTMTPEVIAEIARLHAAGIPICDHLLFHIPSTPIPSPNAKPDLACTAS